MREGIAIYDYAPARYLAFDLKDILTVLTDETWGSHWRCRNVECAQDSELEKAAASGRRLTNEELIAIADQGIQTIWGDFLATRDDESSPWLQISAVDSTCFEVFSTSPNVLGKMRSHFNDVRVARPNGCLLDQKNQRGPRRDQI